MRRREFIALLGGAAVWSFDARAQQPALPVVALVNLRSAEASARVANAFREGLNEAGYAEGQNVIVEYHWLDGRFDRLSSVMADLVHRRVDVIATPGGNYASQAAKAATTTIPIVFGVGDDPVRLGLVANFARPGGNATGYNVSYFEVPTKRLELLHALVPKAVRIAMLVNSENVPVAERMLHDVPQAAVALGLQIQIINAGRDRGGVRHPCARPDRCSLRRPRHIIHQPARPSHHTHRALPNSSNLFHSRGGRSWRADELWD